MEILTDFEINFLLNTVPILSILIIVFISDTIERIKNKWVKK